MEQLIISGIYQHYKNKYHYKLIGIAKHSETLEEMVIYQGLYLDKNFGENVIWVRPRDMFLEILNIGGKSISRFKLINAE